VLKYFLAKFHDAAATTSDFNTLCILTHLGGREEDGRESGGGGDANWP